MDYEYVRIFFAIIPFVIYAGIFYLVYSWVNKFIYLKKEQNDLLRMIIEKMDPK